MTSLFSLLLFRIRLFAESRDHGKHLFKLKRFREVCVHSCLACALDILVECVCGHGDYWDVRCVGAGQCASCENGSKMCRRNSLLIPIPVSDIVQR